MNTLVRGNTQQAGANQQVRRKLITFNGYRGLEEQLKNDESLVVEYMSSRTKSLVFERVKSRKQFRNILNNTDGIDLHGFWAWTLKDGVLPDPVSFYQRAEIIEEYDVITTIRRPVEDVVFAAIMAGQSVEDFMHALPVAVRPDKIIQPPHRDQI